MFDYMLFMVFWKFWHRIWFWPNDNAKIHY